MAWSYFLGRFEDRNRETAAFEFQPEISMVKWGSSGLLFGGFAPAGRCTPGYKILRLSEP
jgi:hypothetical protein